MDRHRANDAWKPDGTGSRVPLTRIAAVFGLSADAFSRTVRSEQEPAGRLAAAMQAAALQGAFARIADPETRRRCLAFVEAAAREDAPGIEG